MLSRPLRIGAVLLAGAAFAAPLAAINATRTGAAPGANARARGTLLGSERIARLDRAGAERALGTLKLPTRRVRSGVDAYRLRYATVGVDGAPTTATALVVLPRGRARALPTVAFEHGTLSRRSDAPSGGLDSLATVAAVLFGSAGYATVAPDYLGLGGGAGRQAYLHAAAEVSASVDALLAARTFAAARHVRLDPRTLVTGFSQGGQAAMALGGALQDGAEPQLSLRALAPISGPYDIAGAELPALLDGRLDPVSANYNLNVLLTSWQPIYHVYANAKNVWQPRWIAPAARLFDGRHGDDAIFQALPHRLADTFTPAFLAGLRHPAGGLLAGATANDATCRWAPRAPVRLYAARGDRSVTIDNSRHCAADLAAQGVRVPLIDVGAVDHFPSLALAAPRVLAWFEHLGQTG